MHIVTTRSSIVGVALTILGLGGCAATGDDRSPGDLTELDSRQLAEMVGVTSQAIVNGYDVEADSAAQGYVRLWGLFDDDNWQPYCSGSLINGEILITAQHCQEGNDVTPVFDTSRIIAQVGNEFRSVTAMSPGFNLDQTLMRVSSTFGDFSRHTQLLDGDKQRDARVKCVGRGADMPDGSRERYAPITYTVLAVTGSGNIDPESQLPRSWRAEEANPDQRITHGDSGGGCYLIGPGSESAWPLVGVIATAGRSAMTATTFINGF